VLKKIRKRACPWFWFKVKFDSTLGTRERASHHFLSKRQLWKVEGICVSWSGGYHNVTGLTPVRMELADR
jgi:hypothetical protein